MSGGVVDNLTKDPIKLAIGVGLIVAVLYFVGRVAVKDAAGVVGGIASGNNALTNGTPYQGTGVVGTIAAAANSASGGALQSIGEAIGGWVYDATHKAYDPSTGLQGAQKTVSDGARSTDQLWGPLGGVDLRHGYFGF